MTTAEFKPLDFELDELDDVQEIVPGGEVTAFGQKLLRLTEQDYWKGNLTYIGKRKNDGGVELELRVALPPDDEQVFVLDFSAEVAKNAEDMREAIRQTIIDDYVFPNLDKRDGNNRKGLTEHDVRRFREIADELFRLFGGENPAD